VQHFQAVAVRQLEVQQHQIDVGDRLAQGTRARLCLGDLEPTLFQSLLQRPPDERLVVDDQDVRAFHDG
jgi:hypothetical protein